MALTPRKHGITQTEAPIGAISLDSPGVAAWGVVATAPAGDFDPGDVILVDDIDAAIEAAGSGGTAGSVLRAVRTFGRSLGVLIVVAEEEETADQIAAVVAGVERLRTAEQVVGLRPRIIAAPGLDTAAATAALAAMAVALNGMAYAAAIGATPAEIQTYRSGYGQRELVLLDGDLTMADPVTGENEVSYATAHAVGLRAWLDREVGYHKTISNVALPGVTGMTVARSWDLNTAETQMGLINGADVTGVIRRNGFRFWGNRTCSSDPQFAFESAVRSKQALDDVCASGLFPYIDQPLRASLARDIVESLNALARREVRAGRLIGCEFFLTDANTRDQLAAGKLRLGRRYTPVAPLEDLGIVSEITDEFYVDFAAQAAG